ncbi:hypothetical protein R6Q59_023961, partial [Mikania micrantha]
FVSATNCRLSSTSQKVDFPSSNPGSFVITYKDLIVRMRFIRINRANLQWRLIERHVQKMITRLFFEL